MDIDFHMPELRSAEAEASHGFAETDDHWKQFATIVAHDLKEPLRNIASCARMLVSLNQDPAPQAKQLTEWLVESSERIEDMVSGLLQHARLGHEPVEELEMGPLVQEVIRDLRCLAIRSGATFDVGPLPAIQAGPLGMRLLFVNLFENALKYARQGVDPVVQLTAEKVKGGFLFTVGDNGQGMTQNQVASAFEPFRRHDQAVEGLGMGLCHVRKIVAGHGGWIRTESQVGQGTTFIFFLPDWSGAARSERGGKSGIDGDGGIR